MGASNSEMRSFEAQWAGVFDQVEIAPSDQLWISIDGALANSEARKYRRGVVFYRLLAAASIFLAISLGLILFLQDNVTPGDKSLSSGNEIINDEMITHDNPNADENSVNPPANDEINGTIERTIEKNNVATKSDGESRQLDDNNAALLLSTTNEEVESSTVSPVLQGVGKKSILLVPETETIAGFPAIESKILSLSPGTIDTDIHMYNVPMVMVNKPRVKYNELWAGLGLSSGNFDPNIGSGTTTLEAVDAAAFGPESDDLRSIENTIGDEQYDPGFSYSIAANTGWRFAPRWLLQGGLQYQLSRSGTQTNQLIQNKTTEENFAPTNLGPANTTFNNEDFEVISSEVNLNNNFRFLSVPVKIGYIIVDRKFQLSINTGLSTDIFLKNKVAESNDLIASFEQSPGNDSPYRRTFFSGLFGIELGYNFLNNYYLTLEPAYKRSLNSFTKQSSDVESNPSKLGLTIGFRYIFR